MSLSTEVPPPSTHEESYDALQKKIASTGRLVKFSTELEKLANSLTTEPATDVSKKQLLEVLFQLAIINQDSAYHKAIKYLEQAIALQVDSERSKDCAELLDAMRLVSDCEFLS